GGYDEQTDFRDSAGCLAALRRRRAKQRASRPRVRLRRADDHDGRRLWTTYRRRRRRAGLQRTRRGRRNRLPGRGSGVERWYRRLIAQYLLPLHEREQVGQIRAVRNRRILAVVSRQRSARGQYRRRRELVVQRPPRAAAGISRPHSPPIRIGSFIRRPNWIGVPMTFHYFQSLR